MLCVGHGSFHTAISGKRQLQQAGVFRDFRRANNLRKALLVRKKGAIRMATLERFPLWLSAQLTVEGQDRNRETLRLSIFWKRSAAK
jgi:hypothetical protein